ncbi:alpha/beta hydrolase-fold protein [Coprococcus sp. OM06-25]|uniref:alpha/beta hydrolase-fold protein n=1 Tax=Coprococcus sp. OM06-25 TaxID=2293094 RepID=UPI00131422A3|nr:alpha/beta hydrolase-fold protein [Coprococcus sp. OM06-25]
MGEEHFTLVAIQIDDWNRNLSPWRSDEVDGSFAGEAGRTLDYIEQQVVPQLDIQSQANRPLYIMGYSLAGLFALWAMYQTDIFAGCATCSGSMWYPGFVEYVNSQPTLANKHIYISLGGKESRTSDRLMATVRIGQRRFANFSKKTTM